MDRVIKFRGKSINGEWYYGLLSKSQGVSDLQPASGFYISNSCGMPWAYNVIPSTVGQFTNLLDKNGNEIYEGDIVKCEMRFKETSLPHKGTVVYDNDFGAFGTQNDAGTTLFHHHLLNTLEIIGNIHGSEVQNG